jgi:hypothetical protein
LVECIFGVRAVRLEIFVLLLVLVLENRIQEKPDRAVSEDEYENDDEYD